MLRWIKHKRREHEQGEYGVHDAEDPRRNVVEQEALDPVGNTTRRIRAIAAAHAQPTLERRERAGDVEDAEQRDDARRRKMRDTPAACARPMPAAAPTVQCDDLAVDHE